MLCSSFGKNAIPVQIPIGKEDDFIGLIDLFEMEAYYYKDDKGGKRKCTVGRETDASENNEGRCIRGKEKW